MKWKGLVAIGVMMDLMLISACNRYQVIPDHLQGQVNRNVTFEDLKDSATNYRGELVVLGGEVLSAKRLTDKTRIEVLQLPLTDNLVPTTEGGQSKGRFLAFDGGKEIVDPEVLKEGTRVTIIGEVQSPSREALSESEYQYPVVAIRDMTVWNVDSSMANPYLAYPGHYSGYGYRPYYFMSGTRVTQ